MKTHQLICFFIILFPSVVFAQEQTQSTNAFLDLQRKGNFSSNISEMQNPLSQDELKRLLKEKPKCNYFVFTESRNLDIIMTDSIPKCWLTKNNDKNLAFVSTCLPGEYFTFQIGLYTPYQKLQDVEIVFDDFENEKGECIEKNRITCFNQEGIDVNGKYFRKTINIPQYKVQALWVGVDIPIRAKGIYTAYLIIKAKNASQVKVKLSIEVGGKPIYNHGDDEGWRKGRLRWLNSTIGIEKTPTKPYVPIDIFENRLTYLGGAIYLDEYGLPKKIINHYDESNILDTSISNDILSDRMKFVIETDSGEEILSLQHHTILEKTSTKFRWEKILINKDFELTIIGTFDFDGFFHYSCQVHSLSGINIKDIRLEVPYDKKSAQYMMGLGHCGGYRPSERVCWQWNVNKHQDKVWLGKVNSGLNFVFMDQNYQRPLVNIYYSLGKLNLPISWANNNKGGIKIEENSDNVLLTAYSGERELEKGNRLYYNFNMLITPVKSLNLKQQAEIRFYHSNTDVSSNYIEEAEQAGANAVNIHHKKDIYPFINYPYYDEALPDLKLFSDKLHSNKLRMRLYYTTRELTIKLPELWAIRSLGNEIIHDGPGKNVRTLIHPNGPHPWLSENLKTNFIPAWYNAFNEGKYKGDMDLSVITTPDSRWNNYYLEGLDWMVKNLGLDGIYIDDSALDRFTLQRARRILDSNGKDRLIDIHSWNHNNEWAGYANSIHIYLELLPYIDRTWIGEGFSEENTRDFWLVEMSGIPFGLMGETLDAHNPFKAMTFGMLPRMPWSGNPISFWKLWDTFEMKNARFLGYWDSRNPVECESNEVKASIFYNPKTRKMMLVLANWSKDDQTAAFRIKDHDRSEHFICYPKIKGIQEGNKPTKFEAKQGGIYIIDNINLEF